MIMAVGLRVSKLEGDNEIDYNSLKCNLRCIELECVLNDLPWLVFASTVFEIRPTRQ